jgi:alginate O-acetyltransferase complex protein AlgI
MSFVSTEFAVFFVATFVAYHALISVPWQNALIVLASYVFYAWWDWRFTPLLLTISLVNYFSALAIERATSERTRKRILILAVSVSLVALAAFKYFNFFVDTAAVALGALGLGAPDIVLEIALPLGISFMTFQGLAYVVDVWRRDHAAEPDLVKFLAFKAFFPQLIAGPIERASNLLDQFSRPRSIDRLIPKKSPAPFGLSSTATR